jgi:hypothetical protein
MYQSHGYSVRSRGGQPGRRTTLERDALGRFVSKHKEETRHGIAAG